MGEEEDNPLVASSSKSSVKRTGTVWTAIAHIITGVIGAGVLSLAWSIAQLGWIAGPTTMLVFAAITFVSTCLLCDCYMYPDPEFGPNRLTSYMDAVLYYLGKQIPIVSSILSPITCILIPFSHPSLLMQGLLDCVCRRYYPLWRSKDREKNHKVCGLIVMESLYGTTLAYVITSASRHQVVMSQIPNFHNMKWLSVVAAIMSFAYASIGFGLGFAQVIENGTIKGSSKGVPTANAVDKLWLTFQALGDIVFAYPYSVILLEIQDTLKSPPSENKTMKKASLISIVITTFFYLCCGCFGYAAFGNNTPGNILTGFGFYEPYWLVDLANACIVLHLVGGYQIFSQPVFAFVERWFTEKFPNSWFTNNYYRNKLPVNPLKICFRTAYVASTTAIAMMFPYFNQVLGLLGALTFWPLVIYFPVQMYFVQKKIQPWTRKWIVLESFSFVCLLVTVVAFTGSVQGLISAKSE
ncbi:hypothetical protein V6N12_015174 [Hibiscus sabdariffa]|uniref:Amino acid transporter transmembrane domain-containing protein n=1 Tax=Hibiscus sabdariffa TaxID=183260 RepID=A0ABR2DMD5_9ROSI